MNIVSTPVADTAATPAPPSPGKTTARVYANKDEVAARLKRYRQHYTAEVNSQLERISDITRALENVAKTQGLGDASQQRANEMLLCSLNDAQAQLREALLTKERLDLEIASWLTNTC